MNCNHAWKPIYIATALNAVTNDYYKCVLCQIIGSKDLQKDQVTMERCSHPECIAPAIELNNDGLPICNNHKE